MAKRKPTRRRSAGPSDGVTVRRTADGRGWVFVHPRCARDRAEDIAEVRAMIEPAGGFILVHLTTPLEVCEGRDRKGMYAKARQGIIKEFTGISDPYEEPKDAEMKIDTSQASPEEAAQEIVLHLEKLGYIGA